MKKRILLFFTLIMILCAVPVTVKAAEPTRTTKLELSEEEAKNETEGWDWKPDADGGGTLTLTNCYIQSNSLPMLSFNNIAENRAVTIVLKGENIIETTSQEYKSIISNNHLADIVIREEGTGSLEVRTSEPITTGNSPYGFCPRSLTIESGSVYSNVEIALLTDEFRMKGGLLKVCTPERINDVFGICSVNGPINIEGGTVDITAGHIGIITSGENEAGWSVNISGGDVKIKAMQSCIQMQNRRGLPEHRVINITGGTFTGESDTTGLYADDINIVKEGEHAPRVIINAPGDAANPNIKAIHAIKELTVFDSIVVADTIYNYDTASKQNCIVFQGENGQVYGEVTLDSNLEIPDGSTLTVPDDAILTIPENVMLTMPEGSNLVNNGTLVLSENGGNISCTGTGVIKKGEEIYSNELARLYPVTIETADGEITKYYKAGDMVELTPEEAPEGKVFKEWKVIPDTVEITDNSFNMPESAVTVSPVFENAKKKIPENAPEDIIQVKNTVKTAADVPLPDGWIVDENDAKKTIPAGKSVNVKVIYIAEDAEDYETTVVDITIKRDACDEASTVLYTGAGEREPNCTTDGIGHTECKLCGDVIRNGVKVPAAGHKAGTSVTTKATNAKNGSVISHCTVCNAPMGETTIYAIGTIALTKDTDTYNGKTKNPSVTVKDCKGNTLKKNTDYTVAYPKNMKNVGVYTVKVTFQGSYEGTAEVTYKIVPKGTAISKIKAKKKGFSLKWKKQTSQTTGYEIQYSTSKKFTKKTTKNATVKKNKTISKSISKQKANKKYYVRIRTYKTVRVNGKSVKLTSGWSKIKTVKTKK